MSLVAYKDERLNEYARLKKAVTNECQRLKSHGLSSSENAKAERIEAALERIYLAVTYKNLRENPTLTPASYTKVEINKLNAVQLDNLMFTTIKEMMETCIQKKRDASYDTLPSLQNELNYSRNNLLNSWPSSQYGPIWGKSQSLINVEAQL